MAARERADLGTTVKEGQNMCGHTKQTVGACGSSNAFVCQRKNQANEGKQMKQSHSSGFLLSKWFKEMLPLG